MFLILNAQKDCPCLIYDIETEAGNQTDDTGNDPMQRLRGLEKLKSDGLISEEEFRRKREEIMQQKW
jgi:hypothetical protein